MNNFPKISKSAHLKIKKPCRSQLEMEFRCLDDLIPYDHKARAIWEFVQQMNTDILFEEVKSALGKPGQMATSPVVLFALWIYGLTEGTFSARKIARECKENDAYRWIAGGVGVNRDNLSCFRSSFPAKFHQLLTESLAVMVKSGLLKQEDFSQDGTRIKASAGFNTFRKPKTLNAIKKNIKNLISEIKKSEELRPGRDEEIRLKRRKAHAEKRLGRVKQAIEELEKHKEELTKNAKKNHCTNRLPERLEKARASYVDPQARKMKMGDGGFRLGYNVQFATGIDSRVIYGVSVVNTLDPGTMPPMIAQVCRRLKKLGFSMPKHWLGDAAYSGKDDLDEVHKLFPSLKVTAPPNTKLEQAKKQKKSDTEGVRRWKEYIGTEEFKSIYGKRCSTAEFSNMITKARGMGQLLVRGIQKALSVSILYAIAFNIMRSWDLAG